MKRIVTVGIALLWCSSVVATVPSVRSSQAVGIDHGFSATAADGEKLEGQAALTHLERLKAKHDRVFAAAARLMEAKGYQPTNIVNVWRSTHPVRSSRGITAPGIERTQTTTGDSSGEVTMWSWDDGDPNTWEGVVYMEDYSTGANGTFDGQLDISTENFYAIWEQTVSYTSGGGSCTTCKQYTSLDRQPVAQLASAIREFAVTSMPRPDIELVQRSGRLQNWAWCAAAGCWGVLVPCLAAGAGWPECATWRCAGVMITCGIAALK